VLIAAIVAAIAARDVWIVAQGFVTRKSDWQEWETWSVAGRKGLVGRQAWRTLHMAGVDGLGGKQLCGIWRQGSARKVVGKHHGDDHVEERDICTDKLARKRRAGEAYWLFSTL
jgi:hypothetical protein